jgi:hypothetical protein
MTRERRIYRFGQRKSSRVFVLFALLPLRTFWNSDMPWKHGTIEESESN